MMPVSVLRFPVSVSVSGFDEFMCLGPGALVPPREGSPSEVL